MSGLNLTPNPVVIAVQGGIFLAALVVIKTTILEPYLMLRKKRESMTTGVKGSADALVARGEKLEAEINGQLQAAIAEMREASKKIKDSAVERQQSILKASASDSQVFLTKANSELKEMIQGERAKLTSAADQVASSIEQVVFN